MIIKFPKSLVISRKAIKEDWLKREYDFILKEDLSPGQRQPAEIDGSILFWSVDRTRRSGLLQGRPFTTDDGRKGILNIYSGQFTNVNQTFIEEEWCIAFVISKDQAVIIKLFERVPANAKTTKPFVLERDARRVFASFVLK